MQPISEIDFHAIISESTPTFIRILTLMQYIIRITDTGSRPCPIHMRMSFIRILFQVIQTDVVRDSHQLGNTGGSAPQVAGKGSVADAILSLAGAENVATHQQYKSYSAESLIAANPEVIVVTSQMVDGDINRLRSIAGITHTAAWKNQRIITVDQNLILGMGPRIADVVESLHQQLWPQ